MRHVIRLSALLLVGFALASPALAIQQGLSAQFRQYDIHEKFTDRPFADGDFGYGVAYELRDVYGYWQLGALYTANVGKSNTYDYAVTPFLNLVVKDRIFIAGLGIAKDYLPETDTTDDDWTDLYWNVMLGLEVPLGKSLAVTGKAVYDFENLDDIAQFRFDDVEFAAALTLIF